MHQSSGMTSLFLGEGGKLHLKIKIMKTLKANIIVIMLLLSATMMAQDNSTTTDKEQEKITRVLTNLRKEKVDVVEAEKAKLKGKITAINKQLDAGEISKSEAERLKKEAAELHAKNIDNKIAVIDNQIALVKRNGYEAINEEGTSIVLGVGGTDKNNDVLLGVKINRNGEREKARYEKRTKGALVFAFGLNNVITKGQSINDSDFKIGGSRFFEIGYKWETRLFENTNKFAINYGLSLQYNGLKPTDNRSFVDTGRETELEVNAIDLEKSKFRMDNLVFPFHLEFRPTYVTENKENRGAIANMRKFRLGIGGYGGFGIQTIQKLKFEAESENIKTREKSSFNRNNFVYGLSSYIGFGSTTLYVKYDLNPIFKNNPIEQNNISIGLRFDTD